MSARSGRTLVEIMIASALLLLLTAACAAALRNALRYHSRVVEQTEMEKQLLLLVENLRGEVGETSRQSLEWRAEPPALSFMTPRDPEGRLLIDHLNGNRLLFQTVVSYRVEGEDREMRRYVDHTDAPLEVAFQPSDLTPARDAGFFAEPGREVRTLARGVARFELEGVGIDPDGGAEFATADLNEVNYVRLNLKIEREMGRRYAVSMPVVAVPRN